MPPASFIDGETAPEKQPTLSVHQGHEPASVPGDGGI
jgi:hypothetical protein